MAKGSFSKSAVLVPLVVLLGAQQLCTQLDVPVGKLVRNVFLPPTPALIVPKYSCAAPFDLSQQLTVVVTVKDACSQMPNFVAALKSVVGADTHLVITYPRFKSCDPEALGVDVASWRNVTTMALPPHSSPMRGWLDAAPLIKTPYALLMHNDGYAIDEFFACELVRALQARQAAGEPYVVAAPMLYESKADGSLAAHATQSRLRVVDGVVRHDHSVARALNRGADFGEDEQKDFLEDHGFLMDSDKIASIIDPHASYTLEYIDMILSLKERGWKVLFVPTARLEFRIAEFSWRDVPYFMYKRSEATCHGTRDYLAQKWSAKFPNTGFWTYIKYTIVEAHTYDAAALRELPWAQQASLFLGFFQMAGFNRYSFRNQAPREYVGLLEALDDGSFADLDTGAHAGVELTATRFTQRASWPASAVRPVLAGGAAALLPVLAGNPYLPSIEADMPLEYLPFGVAELSFPGQCLLETDADLLSVGAQTFPASLCGVVAQHAESCSCWVNLPTFKSRSRVMDVLASLAALLKLPSRVTTYIELFWGSTNKARPHLAPVAKAWAETRAVEGASFRVATCGGAKNATAPIEEPCFSVHFHFAHDSTVVRFNGRPAGPTELALALRQLAI